MWGRAAKFSQLYDVAKKNNIEIVEDAAEALGTKYIKGKFTNTEIKYYGLSTLIFFPFYKSPNNSSFFKFLTIFDQYLFKLKFFQWFAWSVLIRAKKS